MANDIIPQFRKLDPETGVIHLDPHYLLSYDYSDGFTHRLLSGVLVVDQQYRCRFHIKANDHRRNSGVPLSWYREFNAPPQPVADFLNRVIVDGPGALQPLYDYGDVQMSDPAGSQILINLEAATRQTGILQGLNEGSFATDVEKSLYRMDRHLRQWIGQVYENEMLLP